MSKDDLLPFMADFGHELSDAWAVNPPDVVHAHFWMSGLAALIAAKDIDVPVVQTFHALGTVKHRHQGKADTSPRQRLRLEAAVARGVDRVLATCSEEVAELIRMGVPRGKIDVVPCGVDLTLFSDAGPALPRTGRQRIVTVGRLVERKGVQTAIEALASLPNAELIVAGGPAPDDLDDDPDVARLRDAALLHGVADRVDFLGRVLREDMPALLRSADALVTVPWYEPFGITPLEAMACGTPVVASSVGGLKDTVLDGITGLLVPPRRPDLLASTMRQLLSQQTTLAAYGLAAQQRAHARFGWDRIAGETGRVYEHAVSARNRLPRFAVTP
jgi:glycosyltransferase involved in cell wall biosynthesis